MGTKPVLSISMLVSDRPDTIRRCLDSLKPIMEAILCELILVSTSRNQEVHTIIKEYTDKIVEFEWCDDFSKARNAGLMQAKGEWFLTLDDDEWFVEPQPLIAFFQSGEYRKFGCANYLVRNFYDTKYQYYSDAWVSRMIRLSKDTHYESKIHEYLYPVEGECKNIEALAYHTGYIFESEEKRLEHFKRNEQLLQKMIQEEPDRLRWRVQLLQEYRSVHDYTHMYELGMQCIEAFKAVNNSVDNRDIGTFYVAAAEGKLFLHEEEEAYRIGALAINDSRTSELCHAYVMLLYGVIFYHKQNWAEAEHAIKTYFQIKDYLEQNPTRLEIQKGALLVSEAYDEMALKKAYAILIICGLKNNNTKPLKQYFSYLEWEQDSVYLMDGFMKDIVEAMTHLKYEKCFMDVVSLAWNHPQLRNALLGEIAPYEEQDPKGYKQLVHYLAKLSVDHWYLWYAKICDADTKVKKDVFAADVKGLFFSISNVFCVPDKVLTKAKNRGVALEDIYLEISVEKWEQHWRSYVAENSALDVRHTAERIFAMKSKPDIRYDLLEVMLAEYEAFSGNETSKDYGEMHKRMEKFARATLSFVQKYPDEQKKMGGVAQQIADALALEESEPQEALRRMAEISQSVPGYAQAIKNYLLAFNDYYQHKEMYAKKELKNLKLQIMSEVQKCIEDKNYVAAITILDQLKQIVPTDLDILEITLQTRLLYLKQQGLHD